MNVNKHDVLQDVDFGKGTAELDELLFATFVETDLWNDVFKGRIDVVYGAKGAGKSAIYSLLFNRRAELRKRGIVIMGAENIQEEPVFKTLLDGPSLTEEQFVSLWKLYFLTLVGHTLRMLNLRDSAATHVIAVLEQEGLLPRGEDSQLSRILQAVLSYVSVELGGQVQAPFPLPVQVTGRITIHEPTEEQRVQGKVSLHNLLATAGKALTKARLTLWLLIDRLDVAFASDELLETTALRALFRTYGDLSAPDAYRLKFKVFLRLDIWDRITGKRGLKNAKLPQSSAIEGATIRWNDLALMNLVARRILYNKGLCAFYRVAPAKVQHDANQQDALFYRVFPSQMQVPKGFMSTFEWILSQIRDGTSQVAPRDLILLLKYAREAQLESMSMGAANLPGDTLFGSDSLHAAVARVSEFRLYQTLYTEYPELRDPVERLRGKESLYTLDALLHNWKMKPEEGQPIADYLVYLGFFEQRRDTASGDVTLVVPPLYQHALGLLP